MRLTAATVPLLEESVITPWIITTIVCASISLIALVLTIVLWNKRQRNQQGAHASHTSNTQWRKKIEQIRLQYHQHHISSDIAYLQLAEVARDFASERLHMDVSSSTLTDLRTIKRADHNAQGIDLLRQTIAALYPPEFADQQTHALVQEVDVDQAAGWVANLVERWRA